MSRVATLVAVCTLALAACGSDKSATSTTTPADTRTADIAEKTPGTAPGKTTGAGTTTEAGATPTRPAQTPLAVDIALKPVVSGRTVTMKVTVSGTVLRPTTPDGQDLPADTSFLNLSGGTQYTWGDGGQGGSDGGAVTCEASKKQTTNRETYVTESHTYTKPSTYPFRYTVRFCGTMGRFATSKTSKLVIN